MDNRPLNDKFYENLSKGATYINKLYGEMTFSDAYGSSMVIVIIISLIVFSIFSYCYFMQKKAEIYADWNNNRCKPQYIPISGFIAAPEDQSIADYTVENFQYCVNSQAIALSGYMLQPVTYLVGSLGTIIQIVTKAINSVRVMFASMRDNIVNFVKLVMGKILNIIAPLIKILIALMDSLQKTQGVMATGVFTLLAMYDMIKSAIGATLEIMLTVLGYMTAAIAILWLIPLWWPIAAAATIAWFLAAVTLSIMIAVFVYMFGIRLLKLPKGPKKPHSSSCFDKDVQVKMDNGQFKNMKDIQAGDILENGNRVTAKMQLNAVGIRMFNIGGIIVSESHIVKNGDKWLPVINHPDAQEIHGYNEPYLYCVNTNTKEIILNGLLFTDWDEIYDDSLRAVIETIPTNIFEKDKKRQCTNIHRYLDVGFHKDAIIDLIDNTNKKIKEVNVGDTLLSGAKVYGIVEIETSELLKNEKNQLSLGITCDTLIQEKLYHLLTTDNVFSSSGHIIPDYNDHIDKITNL
jgi:hypothetical protein